MPTRCHPESRGVVSALQRGIYTNQHRSLAALGMTPCVGWSAEHKSHELLNQGASEISSAL